MGNLMWRQVETLTMAGSLPGLTNSARLVLLGMAGRAHDTGTTTTPQGEYFGTWDHLAKGWLGYPAYTDAAERAVARAVRELVDAGLIKPIGRYRSSRGPRKYKVNIDL